MSKGWSLCASTPWLIPAGWRYRPMRRTFMQGALEQFFWNPFNLSVFTVFFRSESQKHNQKSQIGICFRVFLSLHLRTGLECSDVLHGKVAETAMNRALLANFVSAKLSESRHLWLSGILRFTQHPQLSQRCEVQAQTSKGPQKTLQNPKATSLPVQRILSTKRTLWPDSPGGALSSLMAWDFWNVWNFVALGIFHAKADSFLQLAFLASAAVGILRFDWRPTTCWHLPNLPSSLQPLLCCSTWKSQRLEPWHKIRWNYSPKVTFVCHKTSTSTACWKLGHIWRIFYPRFWLLVKFRGETWSSVATSAARDHGSDR